MSLSKTILEALRINHELIEGGMPAAERRKSLETVLRSAWPQTRAFIPQCHDCNDTGIIEKRCRLGNRCDGTSTRRDSSHDKFGKYSRFCRSHDEYEHDYVLPCWCFRGNRFRPSNPSDAPDPRDAGEKPMTRFGRR